MGSQIPETAIYPNFEEKWGRPREQHVAVTIPAKSVQRLAGKIVRGIFYLEDDKFIEPPFSIDFYPLRDSDSWPFTSLLSRFGKTYAREPGIVVQRAVTPEDSISSIFCIEIWGIFKMYAVVTG
jgi:hypothetical protein